MFSTLFGEGQYGLKMLFAFVVVFALLALALWLVRRFGGERISSGGGRGRQPRLAVIDAATLDSRRRLVLIRRDNVEHLLLIGGPADLLVEPNIVRSTAAPRELPRPVPATDPLPRAVPLGEDNSWPLQPEPAPRAELPRQEPRPEPRPPRPSVAPASLGENEPAAKEPEFPPSPSSPPRERRPRPDPLSGLAEELARVPPAPEAPRLEPPVRSTPRREARPRPQAPPPPLPAASAAPKFHPGADQNLAEMAQRLEAALRRPNLKDESRTTPPPSPKVERKMPEAIIPEPKAAEPKPEETVQSNASPDNPVSPPAPAEQPATARTEERPPRTEERPPQQKSIYDSLEQEMASLLGKPGSKS
jgi:flagellar protein FliO/FliZ